jgi:hypothetical protein
VKRCAWQRPKEGSNGRARWVVGGSSTPRIPGGEGTRACGSAADLGEKETATDRWAHVAQSGSGDNGRVGLVDLVR